MLRRAFYSLESRAKILCLQEGGGITVFKQGKGIENMNISLENQNKRKHYIPVIFFSSCLLFSILMYLSPLISDDIEFVSMSFPNLSDVIHYSLYYGNGRLLGNISAISLSNSLYSFALHA